MSIKKQLAMNFNVDNVPFPMEIINTIKDYAFIRTTTFIKNKKQELNRIFDDAIHSRKNTSCWVSEHSEIWIFCIYYENMKCFKLEGGNCSTCGEYFMNNNSKISCHCYRDNPMIMPEEDNMGQPDFDDYDDPYP